MAHIEDVLLFCIAQKGDRYVFGTEVNPLRPESDRWDCSELIEIACAQAGVVPKVPDGAYYQWKHCQRLGMSVARALETRGALLFAGDGTGVGRDAITHVALSIGNRLTIEARGSAWGVGTWGGSGRFQFAALIPGCDYSPRQPLPPKELTMDPEVEAAFAALNGRLDIIAQQAASAATDAKVVRGALKGVNTTGGKSELWRKLEAGFGAVIDAVKK